LTPVPILEPQVVLLARRGASVAARQAPVVLVCRLFVQKTPSVWEPSFVVITQKVVALGVVVLLLSACSSAAPEIADPLPTAATATEAPAPTEEPVVETRRILVTILDRMPLSVYYNHDDEVCTAEPFGEPVNEFAPEVTISDGAGTILAVAHGPVTGGIYVEDSGCAVDVRFEDVPGADIYVVKVVGWDGVTGESIVEGPESFEGGGQSMVITVSM